MDFDMLYKIIVVGDSGTGKSSLMHKFCDNTFSESYISTIGIDFRVKDCEKNGKKIRLQIWDTAGQERFRVIAKSYYRGAQFTIVTFDLTNRESFDNVEKWISDVINNGNDKIKFLLVGTKSDLIENDYDRKYIFDFVESRNLKYIESSSKNGENIDEIFNFIISEMIKDSALQYDRKNDNKIDNKKLVKPKVSQIESKCCQ
jgi:Ras-related protein Rab-1A